MTRDGLFLDNISGELHHGLACIGTIDPVSNVHDGATDSFDVAVVGAGYAGLTACRDLCLAGKHK